MVPSSASRRPPIDSNAPPDRRVEPNVQIVEAPLHHRRVQLQTGPTASPPPQIDSIPLQTTPPESSA